MSVETISTSGERLKYTAPLLITMPFGVKANHSAIIAPPKQKLISRNAAKFFKKTLNGCRPNVKKTVPAATSIFMPKFSTLCSGGNNIIREHNAPNAAPRTIRRRFGESFVNFEAASSIK